MTPNSHLLYEAASFAARAHRHQIRKDKETPYVAHPFRVCLVVQQVFDIHDPQVLTAALLHDTIEDTTTDYDDLAERFGDEVAGWVAALSKDTRLKDDVREPAYFAALAAAGWQVQVVKMADLYDNLIDTKFLAPSSARRFVRRNREFVEFVRPHVKPEAAAAFAVAEAKLNEVAKTLE